MTVGSICEYVAWDSDYFGLRIGRIEKRRLDTDDLKSALTWASAAKLDCLYALVESEDEASIRCLEGRDFHLADIRVELTRILSSDDHPKRDGLAGIEIGAAGTQDIEALCEIAGDCHTGGRYLSDLHFPAEKRRRFYPTWIRNSCTGWADHVIVARLNGVPVGYVTCHMRDQEGVIGLVGVGCAARGQGVGGLMLQAALPWFRAQGAETVSVVTQGGNVSAIRLYESAGFRTREVLHWYHKWFT